MKDSLIYCEQRYEHLLRGILLELKAALQLIVVALLQREWRKRKRRYFMRKRKYFVRKRR
jgi:hypothetical protein